VCQLFERSEEGLLLPVDTGENKTIIFFQIKDESG
jgi:hypothetical protein